MVSGHSGSGLARGSIGQGTMLDRAREEAGVVARVARPGR